MNRFPAPTGDRHLIDRGEGPAVLLLHGLGASSSLWRNVLPALAERMRVIVPDRRDRADSLDARQWAVEVRELLGRLGVDEFAVVGQGVGGVVAQLLAIEGGVRCLILIDAGLVDPTGTNEPRGSEAIELDALAVLDVPALVLWGEDDPYLPVDRAERLADAMPHGTLVLLPGCGHFLPEEAPDAVATLITEFLRARYLKIPHEHAHAAAHTSGRLRIELRPTPGTRGPT
jgi:pimeloyl-ACP methyl ester carboxylesterase